jgi:hypothetical protein
MSTELSKMATDTLFTDKDYGVSTGACIHYLLRANFTTTAY